ncbi:efflux RND transporter periplasmic adaptor subunit [Noviherbaspirillum sp.]|uniref:efflux RND transporter periplasmic adaptor subunit n=1 Tax=Noviherbaspirillum sp. TaxID=1926288 RepID=UPI002FE3D9EC
MDIRTADPALQKIAAKHRRSRRLGKWVGTAIAILAIIALAWALFTPDPISTELTAVTRGPMQVTVDSQGQVRVHDKYIVAAPVAAELRRIELHEGDRVSRNDPVAVLDPLPLDPRQRQEALARLDSARALAREAGLRVQRAYNDLQLASSERARTERLVEGNFVSPQAAEKAIALEKASRVEWDAAKSREVAALADIKSAEAALSAAGMPDAGPLRQVQLTSPVDGYVLKINEKSGRTVSAGTPLVTIGDPAKYEIVADILSTDAVKIKPGDTMLLEGWGGAQTLRAKVRLVEPVAFTKISALGVEEQRVNVIADPVDELGPLGDGYRVEARVVVWSADQVTKVAGSSLFRVGDAWHVFTVEDGRAREREVRIGQRNQTEVEILSGAEPGTAVVRYPSNQIRDGARIAATKSSA